MMTNTISFVNINYEFRLRLFMKFSEVMIYYDYNMSNIAKALDTSRQYVSLWKKENKIPYPMQCMLQVITSGKLKASKEE